MSVICTGCNMENDDDLQYCTGCGKNLDKKSLRKNSSATGLLLDRRYEIKELIKSGGMGAVYKAFDKRLRRICAVKEMLSFHRGQKEQEYAVKRFEEEAFILSNLKHDNLPVVYDYFIESEKYYLIMDLIEGEDLETLLKRDGNPGFPEDNVLQWAKDILNVLVYLHGRNPPIVYRDIKPSNIMVRTDGRIMLIDFGIARTLQEEDGGNRTIIGTASYAPLEQYQGRVEPRSDLYALAATMNHLLTGKEPVPLAHEQSIAPNISEGLKQVLMKGLGEKPENRFSSAKEMLSALTSLEMIHMHKPVIENTPVPSLKQAVKYIFSKKWGTAGTGYGQFYSPKGINTDLQGYIYVLDPDNKSVQKFDSDGNVQFRLHLDDYDSVELDLSPGIAIDSASMIYIVDTGNDMVKKFDSSGKFLLKWGGFGTDNGQFHSPCGIAIDSSDRIYVADTRNHRVQIFDCQGNFIMTFGLYGTEDHECYYPKGIATDREGNIYITHAKKNRIQKFDSHGNFIMKFGSKGSGDGQFDDPNDLHVDSLENIYVADTLNNRIQKFDRNGNFIMKSGKYGAGDGNFKNPHGITLDRQGNIYVANTGNKRIEKFSPL